MFPKDNYKDVEIQGRTFRIKKFPALVGSFMIVKVASIIAPLFRGVNLGKFKEGAKEDALEGFDIIGMIEKLSDLTEKDFRYVQEKSLGVCYEVLASGISPVLNENGSFGVIGLEEDTMTVLALTAHAVMFNMNSVFQGSPLASLVGGLLNSSQQN